MRGLSCPVSLAQAESHRIPLPTQHILLWTDGSTIPNPGIGGAGVYIQHSHREGEPTSIRKPVYGLGSNIDCEISAMEQALTICRTNEIFQQPNKRLIIFTDCKFVCETIYNRWNPGSFKHQIKECQDHLCAMTNVPELYWVKAHVGILGNEMADRLANEARELAHQAQPDLLPNTTTTTLVKNSHGLNRYFASHWNQEWTRPAQSHCSKHAKLCLPGLTTAFFFERSVLQQLTYAQRRIICRLITGKVGLNKYLHKIQRSDSPYCPCNETDPSKETIKHYLLKCPLYQPQRMTLYSAVRNTIGSHQTVHITVPLLTTGNHRGLSCHHRVAILKATADFVTSTTRKI